MPVEYVDDGLAFPSSLLSPRVARSSQEAVPDQPPGGELSGLRVGAPAFSPVPGGATRNRKFADSLLEQGGFEPLVPLAMMPVAWCEPDQESRMVLKIERFQPEGMN